MGAKRYITYLLFFISMLMPVIPVIPHHHHADGLICMKDDISKDCCKQNVSHEEGHAEHHHHCCNDNDCVTIHFFQQTPGQEHSHPTLLPCIEIPLTLYTLSAPATFMRPRTESVFQESLHGIVSIGATGLRAPPSRIATFL